MDKARGIHSFWSSFGLDAYDENSVPDNARLPYITYSVSEGSLEDVINLSASIYYRSTSWAEIEAKKNEIAKTVGEFGHYIIPIDNGYIFITKGNPFSQRMADPTDYTIKRIYINIQAEFLTAY